VPADPARRGNGGSGVRRRDLPGRRPGDGLGTAHDGLGCTAPDRQRSHYPDPAADGRDSDADARDPEGEVVVEDGRDRLTDDRDPQADDRDPEGEVVVEDPRDPEAMTAIPLPMTAIPRPMPAIPKAMPPPMSAMPMPMTAIPRPMPATGRPRSRARTFVWSGSSGSIPL